MDNSREIHTHCLSMFTRFQEQKKYVYATSRPGLPIADFDLTKLVDSLSLKYDDDDLETWLNRYHVKEEIGITPANFLDHSKTMLYIFLFNWIPEGSHVLTR